MISSCVAPSPTLISGDGERSARPPEAHVALMLIGVKIPPVSAWATMFRNECCVSTFETPLGHCASVESGFRGTSPHSQPAAQYWRPSPLPGWKAVWIVEWLHAGSA